MAEPIPAPLKIPEISRFINRANQLRAFKPAISYWCEYHAVNQIVGRGLHNTDDDCFAFTKTLLERLEATKAERPDDDAIMDNTAGQAYVEQFAQETFDRAERTMKANKVTRQTADTFDAAATFFDLTHEWGTPEPEVLQKIKFAKWNAARILKAIREGRDPNESNPKPREAEDEPAIDPLDPAVQQLTSPPPPLPQAAYVEDVPDGGEPSRQEPVSEGYFPPPPPPPPQPAEFDNEPFVPSPMSTSPPPADSQPPPQLPSQFTSFAPPPQPPEPVNPPIPPSWTAPTAPVPPAVASPTPVAAPVTAPVPAPVAPPATSLGGSGRPVVADQKNIAQAQKHAKWAISALNFDDVPTAVLELRNALATLGAL
ncbi:Vta1 like domain-containing protein [Trichoderma novae-zelandiae]